MTTIDFNTLEACEASRAKLIKDSWVNSRNVFCAHRG